jgi:hypothetical protein
MAAVAVVTSAAAAVKFHLRASRRDTDNRSSISRSDTSTTWRYSRHRRLHRRNGSCRRAVPANPLPVASTLAPRRRRPTAPTSIASASTATWMSSMWCWRCRPLRRLKALLAAAAAVNVLVARGGTRLPRPGGRGWRAMIADRHSQQRRDDSKDVLKMK